jgi:hypothetical protein
VKVRENSFAYFVYPFLFDAEHFSSRVAAVENASWTGRDARSLKVWEMASFPGYYLLAHVARYLNPPDGTPPTARLWQLSDEALKSSHGLAARADWMLRLPSGASHFELESVKLVLFRVGVGLLTVGARPQSDGADEWLDFLHYFRFVKGQRNIRVQALRRTGKDEYTPFFPEPAGGLGDAGKPRTFSEVINALLETAMPGGERGAWWRDVFVPGQMLPFSALFFDGVSKDEVEKLVYKVRKFYPPRRDISPAPEEMGQDQAALLGYGDAQWFTFSLDGGAFVACNAPETDFFRYSLPTQLREQYFLQFLLALHQRFALMMLSDEVAKHWLAEDEEREESRAKAFERIRDTLLSFTARGYFSQVMQRESYHQCYRKWQETFQVEHLYREVSDEVREMHDYILMRRTERLQQLAEQQRLAGQAEAARTRHLERRLSLLGVCIGIPALVLSFLGINIRSFTTTDNEGLSWLKVAIIIPAVAGLLIGLILFVLSRQPKETKLDE